MKKNPWERSAPDYDGAMMATQRLWKIWMCWAVICLTPHAIAERHLCSAVEAAEAESIAATAESWHQLHRYFRRLGHCDDGAIAEGFSESVSILLADRWEDIGGLAEILESDPGYREFVLRHVDGTVPAERLARIADNVVDRCPKDLAAFCHDIRVATGRGHR